MPPPMGCVAPWAICSMYVCTLRHPCCREFVVEVEKTDGWSGLTPVKANENLFMGFDEC